MTFKPLIVYPNLHTVERGIVDWLNDLNDLFVLAIGKNNWAQEWELRGVDSVARRVAFEQAWGMQSSEPNGFTCFFPEGCWFTASLRLNEVKALKQVLELSPSMPYGEFVNFPFYPVFVPDP